MKIVVFSGTTEGRRLSRALADAGAEVIVCVATEYGEREQGSYPGVQTCRGPLSEEEKQRLPSGAALCVDATHPYAVHVTASLERSCAAAGVPCLRLLRPESDTAGALLFDSADAAALFLAETEGNILLTTGAKELRAFADIPPERLFPRVLPSHESLGACEALGIPRRNIIAMQGPFTREMNTATIRQYRIRWLLTKDGGKPGGFDEKAEAARETGARLLVLRRPEDKGYPYDDVLNQCLTLLSGETNKP